MKKRDSLHDMGKYPPFVALGCLQMSTTVEAEYLSVRDVARLLNVSTATVRRHIEAGELPATQLGGPGSAIRIPRAGLDAWLWPDSKGDVAHDG
jgi:excisionase family DNA binding protein